MPENVALIEYLKTRRSVVLKNLDGPGPSKKQLQEILEIGCRVPDHGKLVPWRLITIEGEARAKAGQALADLCQSRDPNANKRLIEQEQNRFLPAPVTIGVIAAPIDHAKIPRIEQELAVGGVCLNLLHAANAFGFSSQWITNWYAFDDEGAAIFGVKKGEYIAGFIHIGTATEPPTERPRPHLDDVVSEWVG